MTVGGGGVEALFYRGPITPGDVAVWLAPGVLEDNGGAFGNSSALSGLPTGSAIADTDLFYSAQGSGPYTSVKQTALAIKTYIGASGGGMAIGGAVTGGTAGSVLFIDGSANLAQDNAKFFWDDSGFALNLKAGSSLKLGGSSSGTVTVKTAAAAGTWSMTLPTSAGTNLYVLQTDGSGVTSWVAQSGGSGMAIGGAVSGGTSGSILFVDGSGNLAQNNSNFLWDNSNLSLNIHGTPALYKVPNGSGDNWFEAGAGNFTTTGFNNLGTGAGALAALTSGSNNTAIGALALATVDAGSANCALGDHALQFCISGSRNFALGGSALALLTTGNDNVALGPNTGVTANGFGNVFIGAAGTAGTITSGDKNIAIGYLTFANASSGTQNICMGFGSGFSMGSGSSNILIGAGGNTFTSGSSNIIIGQWGGGSGTPSNIIGMSCTTDLNIDYNYITANTWSISRTTNPTAFHLYNTWDGNPSPTNYERAVLDWSITSNVFAIGTQAGGTGSTRNIKFIIGGTTKLDYGIANAAKWTFADPFVVPGYLVSALPTGVKGAEAYVTDGDAGLAWGATAVNSGSGATTYLVWYNGTNWTVVGK